MLFNVDLFINCNQKTIKSLCEYAKNTYTRRCISLHTTMNKCNWLSLESSVSSSENGKQTSESQSEQHEEVKKPAPQPQNQRRSEDDLNLPVPTPDNPISNRTLSKWEQIRCAGRLPERRSYHTSTGVGTKLYIYGGYDIKEGDMKSMFALDISDAAPDWQEVKLMGDRPEGVSRHSAVLWDDKIY